MTLPPDIQPPFPIFSHSLEKKNIFRCICVLPVCVYVNRVHAVSTEAKERRGQTPWTGGLDCEPPRICWRLNSSSLQEQQVLLTTKLPFQSTLPLIPEDFEDASTVLTDSPEGWRYDR